MDGGWSRQGGDICGIRQKCELKQSVVEWQISLQEFGNLLLHRPFIAVIATDQ